MADDKLDPACVLFEDHHLLAVNKPASLLTQAPAGVPNLEALAKAYIKAKYAKPAGVYLGVPHRLDRPVSGAIVFARNTKAAQRLQAQFEGRQVTKLYWALVAGDVTPDAGVWEDWLVKVPDEARVVRGEPGQPGAKPARLTYRVLGRLPSGETLLELTPETGRMHQLRAQSAWRGHPVRGDSAYGSVAAFGPEPADERERVIALHARELRLSHPFGGAALAFVAPLPGYWPSDVAPGGGVRSGG